jgi:hypothetical protein
MDKVQVHTSHGVAYRRRASYRSTELLAMSIMESMHRVEAAALPRPSWARSTSAGGRIALAVDASYWPGSQLAPVAGVLRRRAILTGAARSCPWGSSAQCHQFRSPPVSFRKHTSASSRYLSTGRHRRRNVYVRGTIGDRDFSRTIHRNDRYRLDQHPIQVHTALDLRTPSKGN